MATVTYDKDKIRPLQQSFVSQYEAHAAIENGQPVYILTSGKVAKTPDASTACIGVAVSNSRKENTAQAGDSVAVVTAGRVAGFGGTAVPSDEVFVGATAGTYADSGTIQMGTLEANGVLNVQISSAYRGY